MSVLYRLELALQAAHGLLQGLELFFEFGGAGGGNCRRAEGGEDQRCKKALAMRGIHFIFPWGNGWREPFYLRQFLGLSPELQVAVF